MLTKLLNHFQKKEISSMEHNLIFANNSISKTPTSNPETPNASQEAQQLLNKDSLDLNDLEELFKENESQLGNATTKQLINILASINQLENPDQKTEYKNKFFQNINSQTMLVRASIPLLQSLAENFQKKFNDLIQNISKEPTSIESFIEAFKETPEKINKLIETIKTQDLTYTIPFLNEQAINTLFLKNGELRKNLTDETKALLLNSDLNEGYKAEIYQSFMDNFKKIKDAEMLKNMLIHARTDEGNLNDFATKLKESNSQYKILIKSLIEEIDGFSFNGVKIKFETTNSDGTTTKRSITIKEDFIPTLLKAETAQERERACYQRLIAYWKKEENANSEKAAKYTTSNEELSTRIKTLDIEIEKAKAEKAKEEAARQETQAETPETPQEKTGVLDNIEQFTREKSNKLRDTVAKIEMKFDYTIANLDQEFPIDQKIVEQILESEDSEDLNHISNHHLIETTLKNPPFNITEASDRLKVLKEIATLGDNSTIRFKDIMEITKTYQNHDFESIFTVADYDETFQKEYEETYKEYIKYKRAEAEGLLVDAYQEDENSPVQNDFARLKELEAKMQELNSVYESSIKLIKGISESKYETPEAKDYTNEIKNLKETNIRVYNGKSYNLKDIAPNTKYEGKVTIGFAQNLEAGKDINKEKVKQNPAQYLQEIFKEYTLADLLEAGCLHSYEHAGETETLLVLDNLPGLNSEAGYRSKLESQIKDLYNRQKEGIIDWGLFSDATGLYEETTRLSGQEHYDTSYEQNMLAAEAVVQRILADPALYEYKNGVKTYDEEKVKNKLNSLIKEGYETKLRLKNRKDRTEYEVEGIMGDDSFEINKENAAVKDFIENGGTENWNQIKGSEKITTLLGKSPKEIAQKMQTILKKDSVTLKDIFTNFLNEDIQEWNKTNYKPNQKGSRAPMPETYLDFIDEYLTFQEIAQNDPQRREAAINRMIVMRPFIDKGVATLRALEDLGTEIPTNLDAINSLDDLSPAHIEALTIGVAQSSFEKDYNREHPEASIEFSDNEQIKEVQEELLEMSAPTEIINKVESKIAGAVYASFKGEELSGAGAGIQIPLGEGYSLLYGINNNGLALGLSHSDEDATLAGGVQTNFMDPTRFAFAASDEYMTAQTSINTNAEIQQFLGSGVELGELNHHQITLLAGLNFGISAEGMNTPQAILGIAVSDNEEGIRQDAYTKFRTERGYLDIDNETDEKAKVEKIKKLEDFANIPEGTIDDSDYIYLYERYKEQDALYANKLANDESGLIKNFGVGVGVNLGTPINPIIMVGVTIEIGQTTIVLPKYGERESLAREYADANLNELIQNKLISRSSETKEAQTGELYMTKEGEYAIQDGKRLDTEFSSNVDQMNEELAAARMHIELRDGAFRLKIGDRHLSDVEFYVDRDAGVKAGFDKETGEILLPPEQIDNLLITRSSFLYGHRNKKGGALKTDVIILTTQARASEGLNTQNIAENSSELIASYWENNAATEYRSEKGSSLADIDTIDTESTKAFDKAKEKWGEQTQEYWTSISDDTTRAYKSLESTDVIQDKNRFRDLDSIKKIYTKLKNKLEAEIDTDEFLKINNPQAIIKAVNEELGEGNELSDQEAKNIYNGFLNLYFSDLWTKKGKEGIKKQFESHTDWIVDNVLIPNFQKTLEKLNIQPATEEHAKSLAKTIQNNAKVSFNKELDLLSEEDLKSKNFEFTKLPQGHLMLIGTNYRGNHEGVMASLTSGATAIEGLKTMGLIGKSKEWDMNNPTERNLARVLLEMSSPTPDLNEIKIDDKKTAEILRTSPIALKLYTFEATRIKLGSDMYQQLIDFYETEKITEKNIEGVKKFAEFINEVRFMQINNPDSGYEISKNPNVILTFKETSIQSGAYADCGNLTLMSKENFGMSIKVEKGFMAVANSEEVNPDVQKRIETIELAAGTSFEQGSKPPKKEKDKDPGEGVKATENPNKHDSEGVGDAPSQGTGTTVVVDRVLTQDDIKAAMDAQNK